MKRTACIALISLILAVPVAAEDWNPEPMVIDAADVVLYDFDGSDLEIPFSLSGKAGKIWLVIETMLSDEDKPVAVRNGFKGWHFVNGIDTTVYVSPPVAFNKRSDNIFVWNGQGNEKGDTAGGNPYYDLIGNSGEVPEGVYSYYLWGYDHMNSRELVCDFLPIGNFWEGQYLRFYTHDGNGNPYDAPMLMGQVPHFLTSDALGDGMLDRIDNATICKWVLGSDPLNADLLETSSVTGFAPGEQMPGYGAGVFDPRDHDTFYFAKNQYWDQTQTVVKYQYVPNGEAVQDNGWGDYSHVSWPHPGVNGDNTKHSVLYNLGDDYLVMLDGGTNPMDTPHDRLHVLPIDKPEDELFDIQLTEFYMPGQLDDPETGDSRTISELNRLSPGRAGGQFFITGEFTCLSELVNVNRLIDSGGTLDPFSPDGSGYVVWANSNGDFFFDMSPMQDPRYPEQHWACIVSDPRNQNNPLKKLSPADIHGFTVAFCESMGFVEFGVYCPDGSGVGMGQIGDVWKISAPKMNSSMPLEFRYGRGEVLDYGGQYDGMYILSRMTDVINNYNPQHLTTNWIAFDSDRGIITYDPDVIPAVAENPATFSVEQNSPNPFNPATTIAFTLPEAGQVSVEVRNVAGQKIATLMDGYQNAGSHSVVWDAGEFAAGMYFYTVRYAGHTETRKMTLVK